MSDTTNEKKEFIEVVFVARCKIKIPDLNPNFSHVDAIAYLWAALEEGFERHEEYDDEIMDSICYMAGEFREANTIEDVAGEIGL